MSRWRVWLLLAGMGRRYPVLGPEHGPQRRPREAKQRFQHNGPMTSLLTKSRRNNENSKSGSREWSHLVGIYCLLRLSGEMFPGGAVELPPFPCPMSAAAAYRWDVGTCQSAHRWQLDRVLGPDLASVPASHLPSSQ